MRYTVKISRVSVIGPIWMPSVTCAQNYTLEPRDFENLRNEAGEITREAIEDWLTTHTGDFQSITDFTAEIEDGDNTLTIPWANKDSELTYNDCMYHEEGEN